MPERLPTVPSGMPLATPDDQADEALALAVAADPRNRDSIAKARGRCATEIRHTRQSIANLANAAGLTLAEVDIMAQAVTRLRRLIARVDELEALSRAALERQVAEDFPGARVNDDGTITTGTVERFSIRPARAELLAADLVNRGFSVEMETRGRLLVTTPADWTGTAAAEVVVIGHGGAALMTDAEHASVFAPEQCPDCGQPLHRAKSGATNHRTPDAAADCPGRR